MACSGINSSKAMANQSLNSNLLEKSCQVWNKLKIALKSWPIWNLFNLALKFLAKRGIIRVCPKGAGQAKHKSILVLNFTARQAIKSTMLQMSCTSKQTTQSCSKIPGQPSNEIFLALEAMARLIINPILI